MKSLVLFYLISTLAYSALGQYTDYQVCATPKFTSQCQMLQRGNSRVSCVYVQDSIECAQHIRNETDKTTADFGVFTAESSLLLAQLGWDNINVIKEVRHIERSMEQLDYQSVVVVRKPLFKGGKDSVQGLTFCHPGFHYSRAQRWSERFLKDFERTVAETKCDIVTNATIEELEVATVRNFFNTACRPGTWSHNPIEDARLKQKYPQLCEACDNPSTCTYDSGLSGSDHRRALECLKKGKGQITYVSLQEAQRFFKDNADTASEYQYLCRDWSVQGALESFPCMWQGQRWPVIMASNNNAITLKAEINNWLTGSSAWESALKEILTDYGTNVLKETDIQRPLDYIALNRSMPIETDVCDKKVSWCTASVEERSMCSVIRAAGITTGTLPLIECNQPASSTVQCLMDIKDKKADFMGIDSNYGYIARHNFDLTAAMYAETDDQFYSQVVILVKANSGVQRFDDLRGKKACFPEFGGIASIAFVDVGRSRGVFRKNECNYANLLASYFDESCAPGAKDVLHDQKFRQTSPEADRLCKLCERQSTPFSVDADVIASPVVRQSAKADMVVSPSFKPEEDDDLDVEEIQPTKEVSPARMAAAPVKEDTGAEKSQEVATEEEKKEDTKVEETPKTESDYDEEADYNNDDDAEDTTAAKSRKRRQISHGYCAPTRSNRYFGTRGALQCFSEAGDVAIVELQRLASIVDELKLNTDNYRIMCRNGTVVPINNFQVDANCPLVTIVDGEVVVRRNEPKLKSITSVLYSLDRYLNLNDEPSFKPYGTFNGQKNLLFEDSTVGLIAADATSFGPSVKNYIRLFENVEKCTTGGAIAVTINVLLISIAAIMVYFF